MALHYDFSKVDKKYWLDEDNDELTLLAQTMPMMAMAAGIGEITENNFSDFYNRVHLFETLFNTFRHSFDDESNQFTSLYLNLDEARNFVGFHTNVAFESETKFRKRVIENFYSKG
jgi:hypothetical protein